MDCLTPQRFRLTLRKARVLLGDVMQGAGESGDVDHRLRTEALQRGSSHRRPLTIGVEVDGLPLAGGDDEMRPDRGSAALGMLLDAEPAGRSELIRKPRTEHRAQVPKAALAAPHISNFISTSRRPGPGEADARR